MKHLNFIMAVVSMARPSADNLRVIIIDQGINKALVFFSIPGSDQLYVPVPEEAGAAIRKVAGFSHYNDKVRGVKFLGDGEINVIRAPFSVWRWRLGLTEKDSTIWNIALPITSLMQSASPASGCVPYLAIMTG